MGSFSFTHWLIIGLIVYVLVRLLSRKRGAAMFCKTCGHNGATASKTPGSMAIEIVLWLCFIIPGLVYSLWRISARKAACSACGSIDLVPPDSPVAVAARKQLGT